MTHPTFPLPIDPLVARNPFRDATQQGSSLPSLAEAGSRLPQPVLPEHPHWLEMYQRAWEIAWQNLRAPAKNSGFVAPYIDNAFNENLFMWDTAFTVQFAIYARRALDLVPALNNFYAKQHNDGYICREINTAEGYDYFFPHDPNGTGPNVLAWTEWRAFRHTGDEERLAQIFWPLTALHRWFRRYRTWPSGLYWSTGLSSGMDNQPRVPDGHLYHGHWTWVDATIQASLDCWVLGQIAEMLNEPDLLAEMSSERAFLLRAVSDHLWNPSTQFFHDISPDGEFSPAKSIGAYWALLDKDMVPADHMVDFLRHLRSPEAFNRPHRIPSLSADSPGYDEEDGDYWRGGIWAPTNFMVLKGLRTVGQPALAHEIAVNHLEQVWQVFQHTDTFWENYAPETAGPSEPAQPNFVGWTGLTPIAVLIEEAIGVQIDWPLRQVTWDRRLATSEPYGVRRLPLGREGVLDIVGDSSTIEIKTDVTFNLTVHDADSVTKAAVVPGETTITV